MSEPCLLADIPIDEYHAHPCYSHSKLKVFARGGPRLYYMTFIKPCLPPRKRTEAMVFGDFFETLYQRPSEFPKLCPVAPPGKGNVKGPKMDFLKSLPDGAEYIDSEELAAMNHMVDAIGEHELALDLIPCSAEQVTIRNNIAGQLCQSRPDWLNVSGAPETDWMPYSIDLKTTESLEDFEPDIFNYGYYSQAAMVELLLNKPMINYLLVVEKKLPHRVSLMTMDEDVKQAGRAWVHENLQGVTKCVADMEFPRAEQGVRVVSLPGWMKRRA